MKTIALFCLLLTIISCSNPVTGTVTTTPHIIEGEWPVPIDFSTFQITFEANKFTSCIVYRSDMSGKDDDLWSPHNGFMVNFKEGFIKFNATSGKYYRIILR